MSRTPQGCTGDIHRGVKNAVVRLDLAGIHEGVVVHAEGSAVGVGTPQPRAPSPRLPNFVYVEPLTLSASRSPAVHGARSFAQVPALSSRLFTGSPHARSISAAAACAVRKTMA